MNPNEISAQERWALVLGLNENLDPDKPQTQDLAHSLNLLYETNPERGSGLGDSAPVLHQWLQDIRRQFPPSVTEILQRDALEELGLEQLLLQPEILEQLQPNVELLASVLQLAKLLPQKTKNLARDWVQSIVKQLEKRLKLPLENNLRQAQRYQGQSHKPKFNELDWPRSIKKNLKHYQTESQKLILESLVGKARRKPKLKDLILCIDQSGSMTTSVIYAGIMACILAQLPSLHTRFIAFDTQILDLSESLDNPVDLLFGLQLGGGTQIAQALYYAENQVRRPQDTLIILLSDLYEGGPRQSFLAQVRRLQEQGCRMLILLSLDDQGQAAYDAQNAQALESLGLPVLSLNPDELPDLLPKYLYS